MYGSFAARGGGGGGTLLYGLNGDVRADMVWFSAFFVLDGVSVSSLLVLNRVSVHLKGKSVHFKMYENCTTDESVPSLLVLMPDG